MTTKEFTTMKPFQQLMIAALITLAALGDASRPAGASIVVETRVQSPACEADKPCVAAAATPPAKPAPRTRSRQEVRAEAIKANDEHRSTLAESLDQIGMIRSKDAKIK
jgi:hypothetical protein